MPLRSLKALIVAPIYAKYWMQARDLTVQKDYKSAIGVVRKAFHLLGQPVPSADVPPSLNVRAAHLFRRLGESSEAIACATMALEQLNAGSGRYSSADAEYLQLYCRRILAACSAHEGSSQPEALLGSQRELRLSQVSAELMREFPMNFAPDSAS